MSWPGYLGLARETDYGSADAPIHFLPAATASPQEASSAAEVAAYGAVGHEPLDRGISAGVRFGVEGQPDVLGHLLTALLGPPVTEQVGAGAWRHTFEPRAGIVSYVVEASDGAQAQRTDGLALTTLTFGMRAGAYLAVSAVGVARRAVPVATATASYAAENAPKWSKTTVLVSGAALSDVVETAVTIATPVQAVLAVGRTGRIGGLVRGGAARAGVGLTVTPQSSAWLAYAREELELSYELRMPGSAIGANVASYQVTIQCPRIRVAAAPFAAGQRGVPSMTLQAATYPADGAARGVKVVLVNVTAAYG